MSVYTERAAELFGKGFNCSQAVFAAFCDKFGMDEKTALKAASGLGGGVGRMREVCGAMCGALWLQVWYTVTIQAKTERQNPIRIKRFRKLPLNLKRPIRL